MLWNENHIVLTDTTIECLRNWTEGPICAWLKFSDISTVLSRPESSSSIRNSCRYADKTNMELGLLFTCRLGNVDLDRPVGLLQKKDEVGSQTTMEATLMAQQSPGQREQVHQAACHYLDTI